MDLRDGRGSPAPLLPTHHTSGDGSHSSILDITPILQSCKGLLMCTWANVLVVAAPAGILAWVLEWPVVLRFWCNFAAIVPMASWLSMATEELAIHTNDTVGGLLNATFGNAVELILSVVALRKGLVQVVQNSLLGSVLSNLLFVLGLCFFCGGLKYPVQNFNATAAQTLGSLLALATMALLVPAGLGLVLPDGGDEGTRLESVLGLSRATAGVLLFVYAGYVVFQLKTHRQYFQAEEEHGGPGEEGSQWTWGFSLGVLAVSTGVIALCSEGLVSSVEGFGEAWGLSETFLAVVLLPIVGNAAEHASALTAAMKNKMDLALGIAIGSSMQISLLVTPLLVVGGWLIDVPMSLMFGPFQTLVLFISVVIVLSLIQDGSTNWLEGAMLLAAYSIVSFGFYLNP